LARRVTLTFDNGPTADVTPAVLDCLGQHRIKSTFFVIGNKAETDAGAALVARAHAEGHWIGNHTYSHTTPLGELDAAAAVREIEQAEQVLNWVKQPQRLFRPYGRAGRIGKHLLHAAAVQKLQAEKYTCVLWNSISGDWRDPDGWVEIALEQFRSKDWSLIVLHDQPSGAMRHLDRFLAALRDENAEMQQDFPPECTPIVNGEIVRPLDAYVTGPDSVQASRK
jgi:peptidoglycan/xylan/chitin deacetylase (PgdA/CDA1 family)